MLSRSADSATATAVETCEIVLTTVSLPIYIGSIPMYSTSLGFQAESPASGEPVVVASIDATDEISQEELASGMVRETPQRKTMVEQLARLLKSQGWKETGRGEQWFSRRFHH